MEFSNLIKEHTNKTNIIYSESLYYLPESDLLSIRLNSLNFNSNSKIMEHIPHPIKNYNSHNIAPVPIIENRSIRALEKEYEKLPESKPHKQWYNYTTLTGHNAWVRSVTFDPSNEFFVTGSSDRMIKIWDLGKLELKLTLTGHTGGIRDLKISKKSPYLFSCCDAKQIYCWDLTRNSINRTYFGHFSGVYCLDLHPSLDLFVSGSRDSTARVWDMRTRQSAFVLEGHEMTIFDVLIQENQPNVITSSADSTIRLWDLRNGKQLGVLTNHKKTIRALVQHPKLWSFISASSDAIFQWNGETAQFFKEFKSHNSVINSLAINEDDVMVSVGDDGSIKFWDFNSGKCFQETKSLNQPGSLESECGILDCSFDITGKRLVTCEVDKTIKLWREVNDDEIPY